jgi:hypothetical protein
VAFSLATGAAQGKSAHCFTTDDGEYDCEFVATDKTGSFEVSAPGKPTYSLIIEEEGVGSGFANFGDRNVALPGSYNRSDEDAACWVNDETEAKLCVW